MFIIRFFMCICIIILWKLFLKSHYFNSLFDSEEKSLQIVNNLYDQKVENLMIENKKTYRMYKTLKINRSSIWEYSVNQLMYWKPASIQYMIFKIEYIGEKAFDRGGLTKDWLNFIFEKCTDPNMNLFIYLSENNKSLRPSLDSLDDLNHIMLYEFIGRAIGIAVFNGYNVPINLEQSIYKYLLEVDVDISDLKDIDLSYYNSLKWIQDNSIADMPYFTYSYDTLRDNIVKTIELVEDGVNIKVTDQNKQDFINKVVYYKLIKTVEVKLIALKQGFFSLMNKKLFREFSSSELKILIEGIQTIDIEDWKSNTKYLGYNSDSKNIVWFWKAVSSFSVKERELLLKFCIGTSRPPINGFKYLKQEGSEAIFHIKKVYRSKSLLPYAHTCYNQLDLPIYKSYEELRNYLLIVINQCGEEFYDAN